VRVEQRDVASVLANAAGAFDAVVVYVDNGPAGP
jgi:hypothetical protein